MSLRMPQSGDELAMEEVGGVLIIKPRCIVRVG